MGERRDLVLDEPMTVHRHGIDLDPARFSPDIPQEDRAAKHGREELPTSVGLSAEHPRPPYLPGAQVLSSQKEHVQKLRSGSDCHSPGEQRRINHDVRFTLWRPLNGSPSSSLARSKRSSPTTAPSV